MTKRLAGELMDAAENRGSAFKKKDEEEAPSSFQEALKTAYHFIVKAYGFNDFNYIEIKNTYSGQSRYFSRRAFWELKLD